MTTASAADRVHQAALLLRDAELNLWAAQDKHTAAYGAYMEAKALLGCPQLDLATDDIRSVAERYADKEAARLDRTSAP